jgi:hypothetical protein
MSINREFETVDIILASKAQTRGVDAFALSVIKAERQVRKIFTHLVYQFPAFGKADIPALRDALGASKRVYFEGFIAGIEALYSRPIAALVGPDYARLKARLDQSIDYRNKIFHGQLTSQSLTSTDLVSLSGDIRLWCTRLGDNASAEIGYDGFGRNSFRKSAVSKLSKRYALQLGSIAEYKDFIRAKMQR